MGLVCADTGGIPLFFPLRTGTLRTARPWWTWCPGTGKPWILRVPATLPEAKALLGEEVLRRLLARRFACERDARRALEEASRGLAYHRRVYLGVREERRREKVGRPRKEESPLGVGYRLWAGVERDVERGDGPGAVGVRPGGVGAAAEA